MQFTTNSCTDLVLIKSLKENFSSKVFDVFNQYFGPSLRFTKRKKKGKENSRRLIIYLKFGDTCLPRFLKVASSNFYKIFSLNYYFIFLFNVGLYYFLLGLRNQNNSRWGFKDNIVTNNRFFHELVKRVY